MSNELPVVEVQPEGVDMSWWFGRSWGAPVCDDAFHRPTPVGDPCEACGVAIGADDVGVLIPYAGDPPTVTAWHLDCFLLTLGVGATMALGLSPDRD